MYKDKEWEESRGGEERSVASQFYFDLYPSVCPCFPWWHHTHYMYLKRAGDCQCAVSSAATRPPCAWLTMYTPYTPPLLLFPDLPVVLHSATILHTSSRHPLLFSCHPFSLPSNPLSSSTAVPSLSYFCTWTPFLPLFPLYQSCLTALTMILLFHPGWPVNSHLPFLS